MRFIVTGGAGFIGSNFVDRLLKEGHRVLVYDNFSTGFREFLSSAFKDPKFELVSGDLLDKPALTSTMSGCDMVYHLAASADVRFDLEHPYRDLEQNTIATFNVLEAMRANNIKKIAFSSTGSIYGEPDVFPTPEEGPL
jgi:UDP-glucose 4-epimerase